jgi:hypothetical protein
MRRQGTEGATTIVIESGGWDGMEEEMEEAYEGQAGERGGNDESIGCQRLKYFADWGLLERVAGLAAAEDIADKKSGAKRQRLDRRGFERFKPRGVGARESLG